MGFLEKLTGGKKKGSKIKKAVAVPSVTKAAPKKKSVAKKVSASKAVSKKK